MLFRKTLLINFINLVLFLILLFKTQILFAECSCKSGIDTTQKKNSYKGTLNSEEIKAQEEFKTLMNTEYKNSSVEVPDYCQNSEDYLILINNGNAFDLSDTKFIGNLSKLIDKKKIEDCILNYYDSMANKLVLIEQYKNNKLINIYLLKKNELGIYRTKLTTEGYIQQDGKIKCYTEEIKIYYFADFSFLSKAKFLDQFYELMQKHENELKNCDINCYNSEDHEIKETLGHLTLVNGNLQILVKINKELLFKGGNIPLARCIINTIGDYLKIIEKDNISEAYQFFSHDWEDDLSGKPISFMNSLKKHYIDNKPLRDKITNYGKNIAKELYKIKCLTFCK